MIKYRKSKFENVSKLKKVVILTVFFISFFGGILAIVLAVDKYKNYLHPYVFTVIFGTIGLLVGYFVANKLKPKVVFNKTMLSNYSLIALQFSTGFIGLFLLLGHYLNSGISEKNAIVL